jgi:hypothetical protein
VGDAQWLHSCSTTASQYRPTRLIWQKSALAQVVAMLGARGTAVHVSSAIEYSDGRGKNGCV